MAGFAKGYLDLFSESPSPEGIIYVFGDTFPSVVLQITSTSSRNVHHNKYQDQGYQ